MLSYRRSLNILNKLTHTYSSITHWSFVNRIEKLHGQWTQNCRRFKFHRYSISDYTSSLQQMVDIESLAIWLFYGISLLIWSHLYGTPSDLIARLSIDCQRLPHWRSNEIDTFRCGISPTIRLTMKPSHSEENKNWTRTTSHWIGINWFTIC